MIAPRALVVGLVLFALPSIAGSRELEKLKGAIGWRGYIEIHFKKTVGSELKDVSKPCAGKNCVERNESQHTSTEDIRMELDGKNVAVSNVTRKRRQFTRRTVTEEISCRVSGTMLKPVVEKKAFKLVESSEINDHAEGWSKNDPVLVSFPSDNVYRVDFDRPEVKGEAKLVETLIRTGTCDKDYEKPSKPVDIESVSPTFQKQWFDGPLPKNITDASKVVLKGNKTWGEIVYQWELTPVFESAVVADAGPYKEVVRGEAVTLDGSKSTPSDARFEWNVTQVFCEKKISEDKLRRKFEGKKLTFIPLCSMFLELTVTKGKDQAKSNVLVEVNARTGPEWTTPFSHTDGWGKPTAWAAPFALRMADGGVEYSDAKWGENLCAVDGKTALDGVLHPHPGDMNSDLTWKEGYQPERVPSGPFEGWYFTRRTDFQVTREARFNAFADEGSPPPYDAKTNLAKANEAVYAEWRRSLEQHEGMGNPAQPKTGHSKLIKDAFDELEARPREHLEKLIAPDEKSFREAANKYLGEATRKMTLRSQSADKQTLDWDEKIIWRGQFQYYDRDGGWVSRDDYL